MIEAVAHGSETAHRQELCGCRSPLRSPEALLSLRRKVLGSLLGRRLQDLAFGGSRSMRRQSVVSCVLSAVCRTLMLRSSELPPFSSLSIASSLAFFLIFALFLGSFLSCLLRYCHNSSPRPPSPRGREAGRASGRVLEGHPLRGGASAGPSAFPRGPPEECPECGSKILARQGGCTTCLECGWSSCAIA